MLKKKKVLICLLRSAYSEITKMQKKKALFTENNLQKRPLPNIKAGFYSMIPDYSLVCVCTEHGCVWVLLSPVTPPELCV